MYGQDFCMEFQRVQIYLPMHWKKSYKKLKFYKDSFLTPAPSYVAK